MTRDDRHGGDSENKVRDPSAKKKDFPVVKINKEELRSLILVEVQTAEETAQRERMRSRSRTLVEATICDVFTTGYCVATGGSKNSVSLCVESVITKMVHRGVLHETFHQSFNCRSQWDTFMHAWIEKFINHSGFISPVAAFVKQ